MTLILCISLPRFAFTVAAGGRQAAIALGPAALAPEPDRGQAIGEISAAAEPFGLRAGMRLGEALARCPELVLVPADPLGVATAWERVLARLESTGAAVESGPPGSAWFDAAPLARLHGGCTPPAAVRGTGAPLWLPGVLAAVRTSLRLPARIGAGPSRFIAHAAAGRAGPRAAEYRHDGAAIAAEPVALLASDPVLAPLVGPLERLGVSSVGGVAALGRVELGERFGAAGLRAHDLVCGAEAPLRPRLPGELPVETLELPEAGSGVQIARALELLTDRLLARPERRGRTLRALTLGARLVEGGTWQARTVLREPTTDRQRILLALTGRLPLLPAPAETLELRVERFGPAYAPADALWDDGVSLRRQRLGEAVRGVRAVAGPEGALRVLALEPDSRVAERRAVLAPREP